MYKKIQTYIKEKYGRSVKTCWIADMKERSNLPVRKAPNRIDPNKRTNPCPANCVEMIKDAFKHFEMEMENA